MKARLVVGMGFTLFICVFFVCALVPAFSPIVSTVQEDIAASAPVKSVLSDIEEALGEHIPGRGWLASVDSTIKLWTMGGAQSAQVVQGRDKWLFYTSVEDGNPIGDYQGTTSFRPADMEATRKLLENFDRSLAKRDITLTTLIVPNKEGIYSKYLPLDMQVEGPVESRTDLLVESLWESSELDIIYPRGEMEAERDSHELWYKYDTHWNQLGAYIAVQQMLESWGYPRSTLGAQTILDVRAGDAPGRPVLGDDLAGMMNMAWYFNDAVEYYVENSVMDIDWAEYHEGYNQKRYSVYKNPDAPYDETVLLIGDSFRGPMIPHLSYCFAEVYVLHREHWDNEMFTQINPDRVVLEYVERYSRSIKDASYVKALRSYLEMIKYEKP